MPMKFYGLYTSNGIGPPLPVPIFDLLRPKGSICVFDLDGILMFNHKIPKKSKEILDRAKKDYDWVVIWSVSNHYDYFVKEDKRLFLQVDQIIVGSEFSRHNPRRPIKRLTQYISSNPKRIVAIEDDRYFYPKDRVIRTTPGQTLSSAYLAGLDLKTM